MALKVNFEKTNVMANGGNSKDGMSTSNVDPCVVCSLKVEANSVLCLQCIHSWCD